MPATEATISKPDLLLSFDLEEYFQIEAARPICPPGRWLSYPSRVEACTDWLLQTLDAHNARATFFTLGWIARRHPKLIQRIAAAGHEIASHGQMHDRLHRLDPRSLRQDLLTSRAVLQDLTSTPILGYRAPTFSLVPATAWALDVIAEAGFNYDSSIQPIRHPQYGCRSAPRWPHRLSCPGGRTLLELPPVTFAAGPFRLPASGGGYFRHFPHCIKHRAILHSLSDGLPGMLYFHPWEFDPDQPRLPLSPLARWRTYSGLGVTRGRLVELLTCYSTSTIADWLGPQAAGAWPAHSLAA